MGTLQALLTELSGLKKPRGILNRFARRALGMRPKAPPKYRILVMMATNMPQALDEALLRPGRIDRIYKVGYPSKAGRIRTYEGYLAKVQHQLTAEDIDKLATITPYATGATIKDIVNESLIVAIRDGRDTITWRDVVQAKQLKDLGPPEDVEYIERERHATALHEACHAVVAYRARHHLVIDIATIEKGGTYLGMVSSIKPDDLFTQWRSEYEADVMVSLASLAGEKMFFDGDSSSGVSSDLEGATQIATFMEGYWGMGSTVSSHGVTHRVGIGGGGRPGAGQQKEKDLLKSGLGERIEENLESLMQRTETLLAQNWFEVLAVTHALETNKTLTGDDIKAVVDGTPGPLVDGTEYHTARVRRAGEGVPPARPHRPPRARRGRRTAPDAQRPGGVEGRSGGQGCAPAATHRRRPHQAGSPTEAQGPGQLEHSLHLDDVEPVAELAADLPLGADELERARHVQRDGRLVAPHDAGHHRMEPVVDGQPEHLVEQEPADALAAPVAAHVHGVLDRGGVRGSILERRERSEPHDLPRLVDGDDRRVRPRVRVDPFDLLVERAGNQVEGDRRLGDLDVVDGPDRLGVAPLGQANREAHDGGRYRGGSSLQAVAILEGSPP